jgi:hypothetical protein
MTRLWMQIQVANQILQCSKYCSDLVLSRHVWAAKGQDLHKNIIVAYGITIAELEYVDSIFAGEELIALICRLERTCTESVPVLRRPRPLETTVAFEAALLSTLTPLQFTPGGRLLFMHNERTLIAWNSITRAVTFLLTLPFQHFLVQWAVDFTDVCNIWITASGA